MAIKSYRRQFFSIIQGDTLDALRSITTDVHCVVTSPPYFQKRRYGDGAIELGRENSLDDYIKRLCDMFAAVPLHPRGSLWVNLGDKRGRDGSLLLVPDLFAIAMIRRGWRLLDHVIWAKVIDNSDGTTTGHCMIEPAAKRLNGNGWESFFRFVKGCNAYCDHCAVRLPRTKNQDGGKRYLPDDLMGIETAVDGRNAHNVWHVRMGQTRQKHYAVYPTELCERPIAMTCPMRVCSDTNDPLDRIVTMQVYKENRGTRMMGKYNSLQEKYDSDISKAVTGRADSGRPYIPRKPVTTGWTVADACTAGVVLDPFCGTGTTGEVALRLGRSFIGIDLYKEYCDIAEKRCQEVFDHFAAHNVDPWAWAQ